ncbi:MAG: hypothetical protein P8J32_02550, partial [bacterium]|nr:hypothetical protein [bacterium]
DEAWWLMQQEDSAKFIFALVKRARKYYMGVTTITQDVNDFLRSPYGQAIVTNSAMQLLLKQSPSAVDNIQKTFHLTDGEKYLLLESGVGEGIFFAGQKHAAIKIVASYTEDKIVTTNPEQLLKQEKAQKEFEAQSKAEEEGFLTPEDLAAQEAESVPAEGEQTPAEGAENFDMEADVEEVQEQAAAAASAAEALLAQETEGQAEADKIRDSLSV